ncbi:hypothetical protein KEM55_005450, partial [Ascosphaera atra]
PDDEGDINMEREEHDQGEDQGSQQEEIETSESETSSVHSMDSEALVLLSKEQLLRYLNRYKQARKSTDTQEETSTRSQGSSSLDPLQENREEHRHEDHPNNREEDENHHEEDRERQEDEGHTEEDVSHEENVEALLREQQNRHAAEIGSLTRKLRELEATQAAQAIATSNHKQPPHSTSTNMNSSHEHELLQVVNQLKEEVNNPKRSSRRSRAEAELGDTENPPAATRPRLEDENDDHFSTLGLPHEVSQVVLKVITDSTHPAYGMLPKQHEIQPGSQLRRLAVPVAH